MFTHKLHELNSQPQWVTKAAVRYSPVVVAIKPNLRRIHCIVAACVVTFGCFAPSSRAGDAPASASAAEVFDWNSFAAELVSSNLPPLQTHTLALTQIAVHDAINAIERRYEPYAYAGSAPSASLPAAVAAATRDTLVHMLPAATAQIETRYAAKLASLPDGVHKNAGIAAGQAAAAAIIARRGSEDLFAALQKPYTPGPAAAGVYQPTPPFNIVLLAGWGELTPFALRDGAQFRSPAPFSVASWRYAKDYKEVRDLGSARSTQRNTEQTETARFWFDVIAKEWHHVARQSLANVSADEWQAARTLALLGIAMADGVIASAETKFAFNYWRPITAIRAGDRDGNFWTGGDPAWEPLCATPPFPEHNSTHAVTGAAAAKILALTLGDKHTFKVDSPTLAGVSRTYHRFSEAANEEGISRLFCGIHFRNGIDRGLSQGKRVARHVFNNLMRPLRHHAGAQAH